MRIWLVGCLWLYPLLASGAFVVVCDPSDPLVADRVIEAIRSANNPDYSGNPNTLLDPDMSAITELNFRYWKCSGSAVIDMTTAEKIALDAPLVTRNTNRAAFEVEIIALRADIKTAHRNWTALTTPQKQAAMRKALRYIYLADKLRLDQLDSP